jgi:hypothetical protein
MLVRLMGKSETEEEVNEGRVFARHDEEVDGEVCQSCGEVGGGKESLIFISEGARVFCVGFLNDV